MARKTQTLTQKIALTGGKEIREELVALGKNGEAAFEQLAEAAAKLNGPLAKVSERVEEMRADSERLRREVAGLGTQFRGLGSSIGSMVARLTVLGAGFAAVGVGIAKVAQAGAEAADAAGKQAQAVGLTVEAYGGLQYAAEQSGVKTAQFAQAMTVLSTKLKDAADKAIAPAGEAIKRVGGDIFGTGVIVNRLVDGLGATAPAGKAATNVFARLGIATRDADGKIRSVEAVLGDLAEIFAAMPDGVEKTALSVEALGQEAGPKLIPLLNGGRKALREWFEEARRLGLIFTEQQVRVAEAMVISRERLERTVAGLRNQIGLLFAPQITRGQDALTGLIEKYRAQIQDFATAVVGRGIQVVNEFIAALQGRDAAVSAHNSFLLPIRDAVVVAIDGFRLFANVVRTVVTDVVLPALDLVAAGVNRLFGTDIGAGALLFALALAQVTGALGVLFAALRVGASLVTTFVAALALLSRVTGLTALFAGLAAQVTAAGGAFAALVRAAAPLGAVIATIARAIVPLLPVLLGWPALIVAAITAAVAAVVLYWEEIKAGAAATFDFIKSLFADPARLFSAFAALGAGIFNGVIAAAEFAWDAIKAGADLAVQGIELVFSGLGTVLTGFWTAVGAAAGSAFAAITSAATAAVQGVATIWASIADAGATAFANAQAGAAALWDGIVSLFQTRAAEASAVFDGLVAEVQAKANEVAAAFDAAPGRIASAFSGLASTLRTVFASVVSAIRSQLSSLESAVKSLVSRLSAELARLRAAIAAAKAQASSSSGSGAQGFAGGGLIRGPGGPTSDSILAWLSDTEFVTRAAAVRHYGVAFMQAINSMRLPKALAQRLTAAAGSGPGARRALAPGPGSGLAPGSGPGLDLSRLADLPRFATGGLVAALGAGLAGPAPLPLAAAGDAGPARRLELDLTIGGERFPGLVVQDQDTARRLLRFVSAEQMRSTYTGGRPPRHKG